MPYIEIHTHFASEKATKEEGIYHLSQLSARGFKKIIILALERFHLLPSEVLKFEPPRFMHFYDKNSPFQHMMELLRFKNSIKTDLELVPFLDVRCLLHHVEKEIGRFKDLGIRGIKVLFIPDDDSFLEIQGFATGLGISKEEYLDLQLRIFRMASLYNLPILIHLDLRKYMDFFSGLLKTFPKVKVSIAHFGFSRQKVSNLIERFENCYTDTSSLLSEIKRDQDNYLKFILNHQDRIMVGTDSVWYSAPTIIGNLEFYLNCGLPEEVIDKILYRNAISFIE